MLNPALLKYQNEEGYFCISTKKDTWQNAFFSAAEILGANGYISQNREKNCYSSISLYKEPTTKTILNVYKPLELFCDIDSHLSGATKEEVLEYLEQLKPYFKDQMPEPSEIVYTGRGFQCHFYLRTDSEIEVNKWKITEEALSQRIGFLMNEINIFYFSDFEQDTGILEESRVLRVPGTYNTEAGKYSEVIYSSGRLYSLREIMENFHLVHGTGKKAFNLAEISQLNTEDILKATDSRLKKYKSKTKGFTVQTLSRARLEDLLKLIHLRNAAGIETGYRNNLINILVEILMNLTSSANELRTTVEYVNNEFTRPLSSSEVRKWIQLKSHSKQHFFKTKTIIEKLAITEEERKQMKTLITRQESNKKYNRTVKKQKTNKRYYMKHRPEILGKYQPAESTMNRAERLAKVKQLYSHGKEIVEIAEALNISTRTVYRDLKKIFPE